MNPRVIIWLDPGQTTGVARWISPEVKASHPALPEFACHQVSDCDEDLGLATLFGELTKASSLAVPYVGSGIVVLGYERFEFRRDERYRDKIDYTAPEVIGAIRAWRLSRTYVTLDSLGAAGAKAFWTDEKIKQLGLWVPGLRHGMDALRHLLYKLAFKYHREDLLRLLKPGS